MKRRMSALLGVCIGILSMPTLAQIPSERLAFEVVSIKPNTAPFTGGRSGFQPGGLFVSNLAFYPLLMQAFRPTGPVPVFQQSQVLGLPDWAKGMRYDIMARVSADEVQSLTPERQMLYVRTMLEDRFKLKAHVEQREIPVYALNVAPGGTKLHPITIDCRPKPGAVPPCAPHTEQGHLYGHLPINGLISLLSGTTGRQVVDHTNLTGVFDVDLQWSPRPFSPNSTDDRPPIFVAVREQLGLTLDATEAPVDVLVIDHIERPTED